MRQGTLVYMLPSWITLSLLMGLMSEASSDKVQFSLDNRVGSDVSLSWVNPKTGTMTSLGNFKTNHKEAINTVVGHEFYIKELPLDSSRTDCPNNLNGKCGKTKFKVTESEPHIISIQPGLKVEVKTKSDKPQDVDKDVCEEGSKMRINLPNRSGSKVSMSWVNPKSKETKYLTDIINNDMGKIDAFCGHEFEIQEIPSDPTTKDCPQNVNGKCGVERFKVSVSQEHTILIEPGLKFVTRSQADAIEDIQSNVSAKNYHNTIAECLSEAKDRLALPVDLLPKTKDAVIDQWRKCVQHDLTEQLTQATEKAEFQTDIRRVLSRRIENYTCVDPDLDSTPDLEEHDWINERDGKKRRVHVKLDRPASRIHVVEDFATEQECAAMEKTVESNLRDAAVSDGKGGVKIETYRKALQGSTYPEWSLEADGDPVATLSRRVYDYTNHVLGLNITEHGQEPLMSIQYFGRGYDDTEPDRYTPHCDGQCDGSKHHHGTRMATMVIYWYGHNNDDMSYFNTVLSPFEMTNFCGFASFNGSKIPERGGHTNFQNAAVHVKPDVGNAIFFGYINPETKDMDIGLTQHSGCPVYEGEKKIITQWVRYGVDAATPHNSLNTLGIKKSEAIH